MRRQRTIPSKSMLSDANRWHTEEANLIIAGCARGHKRADVLNRIFMIRIYDWEGLGKLSQELCPGRKVTADE